jgi:aldose 1-epimerase
VSTSSSRPLPPTGRQLELTAGGYRAVVVGGGGGLRALEHEGTRLLDGYGAYEECEAGRGQVLLPWPNRVADGRYEFQGEGRQLDISEPARCCAIHGLVRWSEWEILEHDAGRLSLGLLLHSHPGYPHVLALRLDYTLDAERGIEMELSAVNRGASPAPYGMGMHPYLTAGSATVDTCRLWLPAEQWLPVDDRGIPVGGEEPVEGSPVDFRDGPAVGQAAIDCAFTGLLRDAEGRATVRLIDPDSGQGTSLWVDESLPWLQAFTGDTLPTRARQGLAVEPMTCPPNALATGSDLVILEPGQRHCARWGIAAI